MSYFIYKICCDDLPEFNYIGSTKSFRNRKYLHKQRAITQNTKLYTTIRENGGWDNWRMVIVEDCGKISFTEARIKEEEHRVKLNANLNMLKCYRTEEEKIQDNRNNANNYRKKYIEEKKDYHKEYYEKNKETILDKQSQKITCECGKTIRFGGKAEHEQSLFHKKFINCNYL